MMRNSPSPAARGSARTKARWNPKTAAWPAGVVLAVTLAALAWEGSGAIAVLAGCVVVFLCALPSALRLRDDRLDAIGLYAAGSVLLFAVTGLAWLGSPPFPGPGLDQTAVAHAQVMVAVGLLAFGLGAALTGGRPRRIEIPPGSMEMPTPRALIAAYTFAVAMTAVGLATGTYGYTATDVGATQLGPLNELMPFLAAQAGVVILIAAFTHLSSPDRRIRLLLTGMIAVQVPLGFAVGLKGESVLPLFLVLLAVVAFQRPLPWRALAVALLLAGFILVPANNAYRLAARSGPPATVQRLVDAVLNPSIYRPDRAADYAVTWFTSRFRAIDSVALIYRDTPSVFAYGDGSLYYLLPAIVAVPRALWGTKPVLHTAAEFSRTYWEIPPSIRTSQPLTQTGDLYRNFAWLGVVIGLLLWGALLGGWQQLRQRSKSLRMIAVYIWSIPVIVLYVESDFPNLIATLARGIPLAALTAWLLLPGRSSPSGYRQIGAITRRRSGHA